MAKKVTPCWNQEVKDALQEKKVAYKVWLQKKSRLFFAFLVQ